MSAEYRIHLNLLSLLVRVRAPPKEAVRVYTHAHPKSGSENAQKMKGVRAQSRVIEVQRGDILRYIPVYPMYKATRLGVYMGDGLVFILFPRGLPKGWREDQPQNLAHPFPYRGGAFKLRDNIAYRVGKARWRMYKGHVDALEAEWMPRLQECTLFDVLDTQEIARYERGESPAMSNDTRPETSARHAGSDWPCHWVHLYNAHECAIGADDSGYNTRLADGRSGDVLDPGPPQNSQE